MARISQSATSTDRKVNRRHRVVNNVKHGEMFRWRLRRMETFFLSFAVVLIVFYGFLSQRILFEPSHHQLIEDLNSHRILDQILPKALGGNSYETVVPSIFLPQRPRTFGYYYLGENSFGTERIDPNVVRLYRSHGMPDFNAKDVNRQEHLLDSRDYRHGRADPFETTTCVAQYEWQKSYYPSCNFVMEQNLLHAKYLAHGYWRDVWQVTSSNNEETILKTIRYEHDFTPRNYDRHRRDAVAMERLTSSKYILNIYGFCGNSGLFEFAKGGSLEDNVYSDAGDPWVGFFISFFVPLFTLLFF